MICHKCKAVHAKFKNGRTKKTCPKQQEGEGIREVVESVSKTLMNIKTGVSNIYHKGLSTTLTDMPKAIKEVLSKDGELTVSSITVCRKPVRQIYQTLLNTLGLGQWKEQMKKLGFDRVYHLWATITLSDGSKYFLEKNSRVLLQKDHVKKPNKETECQTYTPTKSITLSHMFEQLRLKLKDNLFRYNSTSFNCQNFINNILLTLGISGSDFVLQNTSTLLPSYLKTFSQGITDLASTGQYIAKGGRRKRRGK